jgi:hypothetical protein
MCYLIQGIRNVQSNTSFLLLKYTYIQGYTFQLQGAIISPLPQNRSKYDFVQLGSQEFTVLKYIAYGVQLS